MEKNSKEVNEKLRKLEKGLKITKKRWDSYKKKLDWYGAADQPVNIVILRNFTYVKNVVSKINSNIDFIKNNSQSKNKNQQEIDKKFLSSYVLLESILKINDNYSITQYDYEVLNLKMYENNFKEFGDLKVTKLINESKPDVKKEIIENFESCKVKVIEKFGFLDPVTNIISEIFKGFMMVIKGMIGIAKFIGGLLIDFVKMLFELLKMVYYLISKLIPMIFSMIWGVLRGIAIRAHLIPFSMFMLFLMFGGGLYYLVCVAGDCTLPSLLSAKEKLVQLGGISFITVFGMWWAEQGKLMKTAQKMFTEALVWFFTNPAQWFIMLVLNVRRNDRMFLKSTPALKKAELISGHLIFKFPIIMLRLFVICALIKYVIEFFAPHMHMVKPTLRELTIFPSVVLRDILYYSGLTSINFSGMFSSGAADGGEGVGSVVEAATTGVVEATTGMVEAATTAVADAAEALETL